MSPIVDTTVSMRLCSTMSMRDYRSKRDPQDAHDRSIVVIIHNTIHVHNIHTIHVHNIILYMYII